jgi:hypothetical protein
VLNTSYPTLRQVVHCRLLAQRDVRLQPASIFRLAFVMLHSVQCHPEQISSNQASGPKIWGRFCFGVPLGAGRLSETENV